MLRRLKVVAGLSLVGGFESIASAQSTAIRIPAWGAFAAGRALSPDGRIVVGDSPSGQAISGEAFRWSASTGTVSLGPYMGTYESMATGLSADGALVCGFMGVGTVRPFLWTAATGKVDLGNLSGYQECRAGTVSDDGGVVAGSCHSTALGSKGFIWTNQTGIQPFNINATGVGISVDRTGTIIYGYGDFPDEPPGPFQARSFRWTQATGVVKLTGQPANYDTYAAAASHDAQSIAGYIDNQVSQKAFVWTETGGFVILPYLVGYPSGRCRGLAISMNGAVVGGECYSGGQWRAWLWTALGGVQDANTYLAQRGAIIPPGTVCRWVSDISSDGQTILLDGYMPGEGYGPILASLCYANCDGGTTTPALTANDFTCFFNRFAAGDPAANCDVSTTDPVLTANDFICFLTKFAAGCS